MTRSGGTLNDPASLPMSMERFHVILDAYGGTPERWPRHEREAAERLLDTSFVARTLWREAWALDEMMDTMPLDDPSAGLVARVLAAAPRSVSCWRWRRAIAFAVPLAAAAALVLWTTARHGALDPAPDPVPRAAEVALGALGDISGPTDVLLGGFVAQFADSVPAVGCADGSLGCTDLDDGDQLSVRRRSGALA